MRIFDLDIYMCCIYMYMCMRSRTISQDETVRFDNADPR